MIAMADLGKLFISSTEDLREYFFSVLRQHLQHFEIIFNQTRDGLVMEKKCHNSIITVPNVLLRYTPRLSKKRELTEMKFRGVTGR